jgi:hypothetical protein
MLVFWGSAMGLVRDLQLRRKYIKHLRSEIYANVATLDAARTRECEVYGIARKKLILKILRRSTDVIMSYQWDAVSVNQ